ncbi:cytochrome b [Variovorax ginsengisoli]|uniref:Cytochrome b561 n=1 Tax=Variovorax ginsengisoli TaxID=363844 RepID=A0ABT9S0K9_9BURK|nr:cytochrome b [Variovorax ginsengisoli]MDP9897897.1 cytochrome b561 [Variovorax ginsengisoli]
MNTPIGSRYPAFLRHTHWITFVLVLLAYITINARKFLERGSAERLFAVESHFLLGMLVLLITVPRIVVRLRHAAPPIVPEPGVASRLAAWTAHLALFVFLVVQPVLGIASRLLSGRGIGLPLTEWAIPSVGAAQPELAESLEHLHEFVGEAFYYVIGIHILAALWHWLGRRDNALQRML